MCVYTFVRMHVLMHAATLAQGFPLEPTRFVLAHGGLEPTRLNFLSGVFVDGLLGSMPSGRIVRLANGVRGGLPPLLFLGWARLW